jgi:hypothetical protein
MQIIQQTPSLSLLRAVLPLLPSDLKAYLSRTTDEQFTFFAPSNAAFRCARVHVHVHVLRDAAETSDD